MADPSNAHMICDEVKYTCRGAYVKCLADDDILEPACVEILAGVLERHPGVSLVSAYRMLVDERGEVLPDTFNKPLADRDRKFKRIVHPPDNPRPSHEPPLYHRMTDPVNSPPA